MAAAGKWKDYELNAVRLADGTFDLDDTTNWKVALFLSTSNANTLSLANSRYGDLTNEHPNANGYTTGGIAITPTFTRSGAVATFDSDDPLWTASGGSITARFAVMYKDATVNGIVKPLFRVCLLDTAPADVTATTGNTFRITMNAAGACTITVQSTD
jgi:hypothetical protein